MSEQPQFRNDDDDFGRTDSRNPVNEWPVPLIAFASFMWPFAIAASVGKAAATALDVMESAFADKAHDRAALAPEWTTPNTVRLELPCMRFRDFSLDHSGPATVICAPFALHGATVADFASGHSLIEALRGAGVRHLFVTDWRSATPDMRDFSIDTYLADLNVAADEFEAPINLVGLCQGGWLALVYAARFPEKVRRLVLAAAPVDISAAPSSLARLVANTPDSVFQNLVRAGKGRVLGQHLIELWSSAPTDKEIEEVLQIPAETESGRIRDLKKRFKDWHVTTVDLPGAYYLQVVRHLFRENQIAGGQFVALGRRISLGDVTVPVFLLVGSDDEIVAPEQVLATKRLIGTQPARIATRIEPGRHLSLFIGERTLTRAWQDIAHWLVKDIE